jgi:hypothetical protein
MIEEGNNYAITAHGLSHVFGGKAHDRRREKVQFTRNNEIKIKIMMSTIIG